MPRYAPIQLKSLLCLPAVNSAGFSVVDHGGTARTFSGAESAMHATYGAGAVYLTSKIDLCVGSGTWLNLLAQSVDLRLWRRRLATCFNVS